MFFAFCVRHVQRLQPVKRMGYVYQQFQAGAGRHHAGVCLSGSTQEEVIDQPGGKFCTRFSREIEFDDVTFRLRVRHAGPAEHEFQAKPRAK